MSPPTLQEPPRPVHQTLKEKLLELNAVRVFNRPIEDILGLFAFLWDWRVWFAIGPNTTAWERRQSVAEGARMMERKEVEWQSSPKVCPAHSAHTSCN